MMRFDWVMNNVRFGPIKSTKAVQGKPTQFVRFYVSNIRSAVSVCDPVLVYIGGTFFVRAKSEILRLIRSGEFSAILIANRRRF